MLKLYKKENICSEFEIVFCVYFWGGLEVWVSGLGWRCRLGFGLGVWFKLGLGLKFGGLSQG